MDGRAAYHLLLNEEAGPNFDLTAQTKRVDPGVAEDLAREGRMTCQW